MKKAIRVVAWGLLGIILLCFVIIVVAVSLQALRDNKMNDDISSFLKEPQYQQAVGTSAIAVFEQKISCGYATIELFGQWSHMLVTEQSLYDQYGKVVTSTGSSFCEEMNKQFPQYKTTMHKNLTNTELLGFIHDSLSKGIPVPFEFAAIFRDYNGEEGWTLQYSLVTKMDIANNQIEVCNPYGYYETYIIENFLKATRFESYENMPLFFKLAFAFGVFEKNTVFIVEE